MKTTQLKVLGMTCNGCAGSVTRALQAVPGVRSVNVDLQGGRATVEHEDSADPATLLEAVREQEFESALA